MSANILDFNNNDINIITRIINEISLEKCNKDSAPWIHNIYFVGATLFIDGYFNNVKDSMTICFNNQTVGFFSGGYRKLLPIDSLRYIGEIMDSNKINKKEISWL
jgi:hypothetical protein